MTHKRQGRLVWESYTGAENARDAGIVCVSQTVLTKDNENEIMDIFKFVRGMGVQRCRVWDITPKGMLLEIWTSGPRITWRR
jgi:MoaA/NifB/PqqE/SkfB family radical SAM enzyme